MLLESMEEEPVLEKRNNHFTACRAARLERKMKNLVDYVIRAEPNLKCIARYSRGDCIENQGFEAYERVLGWRLLKTCNEVFVQSM